MIKSIFDAALTDQTAYRNLEYLCKNTKGRLPGSPAAAEAVEYTRQELIKAGADTVWLQRVPVPHWERGFEECKAVSSIFGVTDLSISTLGFSVGTTEDGIIAGVIEVKDFDELKKLGKQKIEGKIVFFNRAADNTLVNTFAAYGGAVSQRTQGASEASKFGAAAVIVRSATNALDDFPHTGVTRYADEVTKIPAVAVSTIDAELLSKWLRRDPATRISLISTCMNYPDTWSYNVIGEIKGSLKPNEYITNGGHLDAWDITEGAHDDAGGCVQAIEMIRLYKTLNIKPKRTVRAVMFMNEEMSGTGGRGYASEASAKGEVHYAAIESDRGVMSPRGFGFEADGERLEKLQSLAKWFAPYNIRDFDKGGSGSDISPLRPSGTLLIGYIPDVQRYFYYHHSANDTFDKVNIRELQMGSAASAALVYLIDLLDI
ncbi:MAG: M20/M25/M40 family metallo-hydrolase [Bacteroidetes bacterium]|nr:M20/M25/M40 family metallo-hydrolase [Bacteroidota bacterium]